jgi:hypothetical protein
MDAPIYKPIHLDKFKGLLLPTSIADSFTGPGYPKLLKLVIIDRNSLLVHHHLGVSLSLQLLIPFNQSLQRSLHVLVLVLQLFDL